MKTIRTITEFRQWLANAAPGEAAVYHIGFLMVDRELSSRRQLDALAARILAASRDGLVHLAQRRLSEFSFTYIAQRARKPLAEQVRELVA